MLGCYDFCGHYEWTFEWLRLQGGEELVGQYWRQAISEDSQKHAAELIKAKGFQGMREYWDHTLEEEGAGFSVVSGEDVYRSDMQDCPSKGFLIRNQLEQYHDYCDHCIGWVQPMMDQAGFRVTHEHNHCGQCWWEFRRKGDPSPCSQPGTLGGAKDVRKLADWKKGKIQRFGEPTGS